MRKTDYDIVIAGGGIVGCAAALALSKKTNYSIALIEAFEPSAAGPKSAVSATVDTKSAQHPSFDARVVALAKESFIQLKEFGIEIIKRDQSAQTKLSHVEYCPIHHIHVSDRGHLGQVQLKRSNQASLNQTGGIAQKQNADENSLGYVVSLFDLGQQVLEQLKQSDVDYLCPESIQSLDRQLEHNVLRLKNSEISTKLVIIAEGGGSPSRELFGLTAQHTDYLQTAIIANVITQLPHKNSAFERFTSQGPIALLPMNTQAGNQMSLVWTLDSDKAEAILGLDEASFLQKLQRLFGDKLGAFKAASKRYSYPLSLMQVTDYAAHRVMCLGNAAQTLHPIAGQGFNLGIRDIKGVLDVLTSKMNNTQAVDPGAFEVTQTYKHARAKDKSGVISATDALVNIFSNQHFPLVIGRNLSLIALNHSPMLKNKLVSFAMGER